MSFLNQFPDRESLEAEHANPLFRSPLKVNNHIHTPYSFSAFRSVQEAVDLAKKEGIGILGINDFYVTDGYEEFIAMCRSRGLFPLLNIELIGISREDQEAGLRVNDPGNPGRTYISGKGLAFPSILPAEQKKKLEGVVRESNRQIEKMVDLLNRWLEYQRTGISLSVDEIFRDYAVNLLRERHVAKALRLKLEGAAPDPPEFARLLEQVYGGRPSEKQMDDKAGIEDELRARLLKSGAPAFVPEDERAFLSLDEITGIIRDAGGIPTYPMLLDGTRGAMTGFEEDRVQLLHVLRERGFTSVELIPLRNRLEVLKEYAEYFYENGFVVSFGTEHNTSVMTPLTVQCKYGASLDETLVQISFNGAAYQAAHQYRTVKEGPGYPPESREEMEQLGRSVLNHYFTSV
jgi:hypothetical protein